MYIFVYFVESLFKDPVNSVKLIYVLKMLEQLFPLLCHTSKAPKCARKAQCHPSYGYCSPKSVKIPRHIALAPDILQFCCWNSFMFWFIAVFKWSFIRLAEKCRINLAPSRPRLRYLHTLEVFAHNIKKEKDNWT